jgi:hypothetical protein
LPKFGFKFFSHTFYGCHTFMVSHTLAWQIMAGNQTDPKLEAPSRQWKKKPPGSSDVHNKSTDNHPPADEDVDLEWKGSSHL